VCQGQTLLLWREGARRKARASGRNSERIPLSEPYFKRQNANGPGRATTAQPSYGKPFRRFLPGVTTGVGDAVGIYWQRQSRQLRPCGPGLSIRLGRGARVSEHVSYERREVHYAGWVQGVGFRYTVQRIARQCGLVGFVRNLRDGRVQLVAEATAAQLDRCLGQIAETMDNYIESAEVDRTDATGEFSGFDIRF
jgi:acylphosphatase